jgi:regulator of replication initiation timing
MENRISAMENDMGDMKSMVKNLIEKIHSQSIAIGELGKQMGKKIDEPAGEGSKQMQQQCVVLSEIEQTDQSDVTSAERRDSKAEDRN